MSIYGLDEGKVNTCRVSICEMETLPGNNICASHMEDFWSSKSSEFIGTANSYEYMEAEEEWLEGKNRRDT